MKRQTKYRIYMSLITMSLFAFFFTLTSVHQPTRMTSSNVHDMAQDHFFN